MKQYTPFVLYIFPQSRRGPLDAYLKGKGSNLSFQGLFLLKERRRVSPFYSDRAFSRWNLLHWVFWPLEQIFLRTIGHGFKLDQALLLLPEFRRADVIVATNDSAGLPVLWLKSIGLIRAPIVYISFGLGKSLRHLLRQAHTIVSYAASEARLFTNLQLGVNIRTFPFGVDTDFYHHQRMDAGRTGIISVGRDPQRDYTTFFAAIAKMSTQATVICEPKNIEGLSIPKNVNILHNIPEEDVRSILDGAALSVIPLRNVDRPAGQIVLLESLAMEVPTIVSAVGGITSAYRFRHKQHCYFVKPGDVAELQKGIEWVLTHPRESQQMAKRGARIVHRLYTQKQFAQKMEKIILDVWRNR